jgi:hypothetical protein
MVCAVLGLYTPSWCWYRCQDLGTTSIDWAWVGFTWRRRQNPVSETLVVFCNINRTVDNAQNHNICTRQVAFARIEYNSNRGYEVCSALLLRGRKKNEPFLDRIVTCDEKWVSCGNSWRSTQWLDYGGAPNTSQSQSCFYRRLWSHFGGLQLVSSTTTFWIETIPLLAEK